MEYIENPMSFGVLRDMVISAMVAPVKGSLLSSGNSFTVPASVNYVSICALYEGMD